MARDYAYHRSFQAQMKSTEIVVLADAGSLAGRRDPGGKGGVGAEYVDGLKYGKLESSKITFLGIWLRWHRSQGPRSHWP
jgi:hypothetical protein